MHLLAQAEREKAILRPPHNQHRHLQLRQQGIGGVAAREHGRDCPVDHPGAPVRDAQDIPRHEARNPRRVGHQQRVQLVQLGGRGGRKQPRVPGGLCVDADAVEEHQPPHPFRMPKGQMLHDAAAHRPAAQVHLLQPQRIEKAHYRLGLVGN